MTPTQRLIRSIHEPIYRGWNRPRFIRLAATMGLAHTELADLAGLPTSTLRRCFAANRFPPAVCLHLQNFENYWHAMSFGRKPKYTHALDHIVHDQLSKTQG